VRALRSINERSQDFREGEHHNGQMAGGESGGQAPVCDHGGRSSGLVRDPNRPQSQWLGHRRKPHKARRTDKPGDCIAIPTAAGPREARADVEASLRKTSLNSKVTRLEKQISSLSRRDETPSSTTGPNEIIDDRFWISYDYQELSSKIGRAGRLLALLGLPLSSNAEEWLRLRLLLRGGTRIARWR
jgi:hypothetical protein